jgi:histidinol phosphatase-like PHP family hydrolase
MKRSRQPTYADFHVHTHLSPCGKPQATAAALISRAREKGIAAIGFADHFTPAPVPGCPFYDRQRIEIVTALRAEIAALAPITEIEIAVGVEADYTLAGPACMSPETLSQVDHVVCAASHFHLPAAPQPTGEGLRAKAELMLRMAREALIVPGVSIWAHPFDCSSMRPLAPILETTRRDELAALIDLANERQVAIEINGGPGLLDEYRQATAPLFRLARDLGARFTITADAHHPDDFTRLDLALDWAREMGFQNDDFLTPQELRARHRSKIS